MTENVVDSDFLVDSLDGVKAVQLSNITFPHIMNTYSCNKVPLLFFNFYFFNENAMIPIRSKVKPADLSSHRDLEGEQHFTIECCIG